MLARLYEGLPGAVRHGDEPWRFGDDEDFPPFLRATVEPAGLGSPESSRSPTGWRGTSGFDPKSATDCPRGCENSHVRTD